MDREPRSGDFAAVAEERLIKGVGVQFAAHAGLGGAVERMEDRVAGAFQIIGTSDTDEIAGVEAVLDFILGTLLEDPL